MAGMLILTWQWFTKLLDSLSQENGTIINQVFVMNAHFVHHSSRVGCGSYGIVWSSPPLVVGCCLCFRRYCYAIHKVYNRWIQSKKQELIEYRRMNVSRYSQLCILVSANLTCRSSPSISLHQKLIFFANIPANQEWIFLSLKYSVLIKNLLLFIPSKQEKIICLEKTSHCRYTREALVTAIKW